MSQARRPFELMIEVGTLKRFYQDVTIEEGPEGYAILLDARPVKTPARKDLVIPNKALAKQVEAEWEAQTGKVNPASMPMTKRVNTALDRVQDREQEVVEEIVSFAGSDLLCYRADHPEALVAKQKEHWDPVLGWVRETCNAQFEVQTGIVPVSQPEKSLERIVKAIGVFDHFVLTPIHTVTTLTGSALLALALVERHLDPEAVWSAAHVDEDWQISQWGEDAEAKARRAMRRAEFDADVRFLELLRSDQQA